MPTRPRGNMSRSKLIQLIHVAKKQLGLSDENYHSLISEVKTGVASCTDLSVFQLGELYKLLRAAGFRPTKKIPDRAPENRDGNWASPNQLSYIRSLWPLCSRNKSEQSLNKMCQRTTGIAMINWLDKDSASQLIIAIRKMGKRTRY